MTQNQTTNIDKLTIYAIVFVLVVILLGFLGIGSNSNYNTLQQERFAYEAERNRQAEQIRVQEELNKIHAGYYQ